MLRGQIPPQVFNHRRALFLLGVFLAECTFLPGIFLTGHFYRGICSATLSATLSDVVSRIVPRSIAKVGQTFCVDACARILD